MELAADAAEAEVARTKNESADAGLDQGSGAHDAGLEGGIERGAFEAIVADRGGGLAEGEDFGVGGGVVEGDGGVGASTDDFASFHGCIGHRDGPSEGRPAGSRGTKDAR